MVEIIKQENSFKVVFTQDDFYLYTGDIVLPFNSLTLVVDESDMATFRRSATNDLLFSCPIDELEIASTQATKQNIKTLFNDNCCSKGAVDAYTKEEADSIFQKILTAGEGIDIVEGNNATLIIGGLRYVSWSNIKDLDKDGKYITVTPIMSNTDYDFNQDGVTDYRDLMVLVDYILGKPVTKPAGMTDEEWRDWLDINQDSRVNVSDITALITIIRNDASAKKAIVIFQFTDGTITELDRFEAGSGTGNGLYLKDVNGNIKQNTDSNDYSGSDNVYITPAPIIISTELANSNTILMGKDAHASGNNQIAIGQGTHTNYPSEVSIGRYNKIIGYQKFSVGDGTGDNGNLRHNLFYVDSDGSFYIVDCDKIGQSDGQGGTYTYETAPYIKIQDAVADSKVFLVNFRQNGPIGWTADQTYADTLAAVADGKLVVFSYVNVTTTEYGIAYHLGSLNKFQADIIELDNNVMSITLDSNDTALLAINKTLATTASNNLTNYYTKTDSYNKTEVDNLIAGAGGGLYEKDTNGNVKQNTDTNVYTGSGNTFLGQPAAGQALNVGDSVVIGNSCYTKRNQSISIGYSIQNNDISTVAIGQYASAQSPLGYYNGSSVVIGNTAQTRQQRCIAIGPSAKAGKSGGNYQGDVAIGDSAIADNKNCVAVGTEATAHNIGEVSIGTNNNSVTTGTDDQLTQFSVGDGADSSNKHNLFWVAKDGSFNIVDTAKVGQSDGNGGTYTYQTAPYITVQDALASGGGSSVFKEDSNGNITLESDSTSYTSRGSNNIMINLDTTQPHTTAFADSNQNTLIGIKNRVSGHTDLTFIAGQNNEAGNKYETAFGFSNKSTTTSSESTRTLFSIGNGRYSSTNDTTTRHNAFEVEIDGSLYYADTSKIGQSDGQGGTYSRETVPMLKLQDVIGDIDTVLSNIVGV